MCVCVPVFVFVSVFPSTFWGRFAILLDRGVSDRSARGGNSLLRAGLPTFSASLCSPLNSVEDEVKADEKIIDPEPNHQTS